MGGRTAHVCREVRAVSAPVVRYLPPQSNVPPMSNGSAVVEGNRELRTAAVVRGSARVVRFGDGDGDGRAWVVRSAVARLRRLPAVPGRTGEKTCVLWRPRWCGACCRG
jgi:hypothetical protein